MIAKLKLSIDDGRTYHINMRGRGIADLQRKCDAIVSRLTNLHSVRASWDMHYRDAWPGLDFVRVNNKHHVTGTVYLAMENAHILKELN